MNQSSSSGKPEGMRETGVVISAYTAFYSKKSLIQGIFLIIVLLSLSTCSDDPAGPDVDDGDDVAAVGIVTGTITAANGETPIQGAVVRLKTGEVIEDDDYDGPEDVSDVEGRYTLEGVPEGEQTLIARQGVFLAEMKVTVVGNETVEAPAGIMESVGGLAYIPGVFDSIEEIIQDELGLEVEQISFSDLSSNEITSGYSMIFINCGSDDGWDYYDDEATLNNLRSFMDAGGALYISDLELFLVMGLFPDDVGDFMGGDEGIVEADVVHEGLQDFLGGSSTVEIRFNFDGWLAVADISDQVEVLLQGDYVYFDENVEDEPLAVVIHHGNGALVYTSFHNIASPTGDQRMILTYFILGFGNPEMQQAVLAKLQDPDYQPFVQQQESPLRPHHVDPRAYK